MHSAKTPPHPRLLSALLLLSAWPALADTPPTDSLERVTITGSRIARSAKEGPTSVTVISGDDIEKQGYTNVYDALNNLTQNTGFTQGADFGNTFTPAANAISLRGLGPNHTLTLINGRRVADYPTAYDGSVNFVNLANIPAAIIERIEVLSGGASAIYGSDAIAGVVNIILKRKTDGVVFNAKVGSSEHHGGENARLQLSGSGSWERLSTVFALELSQRNAIWARQRGFISDTTIDNSAPTTIWSRQIKKGPDKGKFLGASDCSSLAGQFNGSTRPYSIDDDTGQGTTCASGQAKPSYWTIQTANQSQNGYFGANYQLDDHRELFGDLLLGLNHTENNTSRPSWTSLGGSSKYFFNQNTNQYEQWTRIFSPEEIGGARNNNRKWDDVSASLTFGLRGDIPSTSWSYEAAYNASVYTSQLSSPRLLANIDSYLLGPKLGSDRQGIGIYAPDSNRFSSPLTPNQYQAISGRSVEQDKSWLQTFSLSSNGELFSLPAGAAKLASVLEWGSQGFSNDPDPKLGPDTFYRSSPGIHAGGTRSRSAAGLELLLPLHQKLNLTLSGRYDQFKTPSSSIGKFTYGSGLEYRPLKSLLLRGNYATSFRAPDMNYLFLTQSQGYYPGVNDYWRCQQAGQPLSTCKYADINANFVKSGNAELKPENGQSWGLGFVWAPSNDADLSIDYWNVHIRDLVTDLDPDKILRTEADCRSGAQDPNSAQCQDALSRVQRNPTDTVLDPGAIKQILTNPINAAQQTASGVDLAGKLRWRTRHGDILLSATYTRMLSFRYQQFSGDPVQDRLAALDNSDWRDKLGASLNWNIGPWSSTLQLTRYGKIPNREQTGYITPTILANASVYYQLSRQTSLGLIINNVQDFFKKDYSSAWPYYPVGSYAPYGRQAWLELNHKF